MKKNRLFEKDIKKSLLLKVIPVRVFYTFLGITMMLTSISVANAMRVKDGTPIKKNRQNMVYTVSSFMRDNNLLNIRSVSSVNSDYYFPKNDIKDLGNKGFIYPFNQDLENIHGQLLYSPFEFSDYAIEKNNDPALNEQFSNGMLDKNLKIEKTENSDGTVSWTITFYPDGGIYNDKNNASKKNILDNAVMGVAFTKGIQVQDGGKIHIEVYDTKNNSLVGGKDVYPGGRNNLNQVVSGSIEKGEYTQSTDRTAKLFFGHKDDRRDPINLRAGGLQQPNKYKIDLFEKSIVFETTDTRDKKYVVTFKTVEDYSKRANLRALPNNNGEEKSSAKELEARDKYLSGVMAGIGSYQNAITVSGVKFIGEKMSDKVVYVSTIKVNETFLTDDNPINVPERNITFNKPQSQLYNGSGAPIEYSVGIEKTLAMPSADLSGGKSSIATEYTMVDYEKYIDDKTAQNSKNESAKHTDYRDIRSLVVTMSKLAGYSTEIKNNIENSPEGDRVLEVNIVHTKDGYSPEKRVKHDLDDLTKELTAYINDYPVGVGHAEVSKSNKENLNNVPTAEDLAKLANKQKEIEDKIAAIKEYIKNNTTALGDKVSELNKIVEGYEIAFNGLNKDKVIDYEGPKTATEPAGKYKIVKDLPNGTITSPKFGKPYYSVVKELNDKVKEKLDENTDFTPIQQEYGLGKQVERTSRYNDATPDKKEAFDKALKEVEKLYKAKESNYTLAEVLNAKRALNKAVIELDQINVPAPELTAPSEGDKTITSNVPKNAKAGDVIKVYKVNKDGTKEEVGSYTLKAGDLSKETIDVPLSNGKSLAEGDSLKAVVNRGDKSSEESKPVVVKAAPVNPPVLTAPNEEDGTVTSSIPKGAKTGDIIKLYKVVSGKETEIGSYTLTEEDLTKDSVSIPVNKGETLAEGETLKAKTSRGDKVSEDSDLVTVLGAPVCTQGPAGGIALNTSVGVSTLDRDNGEWNLEGLGAYIALESNTKGFVITRNANPETNIKKPVEGMLVWDTTAKCLKLYSDKTGKLQWNCIKQGCNKKK